MPAQLPLLSDLSPEPEVKHRWQCSYCGRFTDVINTGCKGYCFDNTGDSCDGLRCECGKKHYWTGSFIRPPTAPYVVGSTTSQAAAVAIQPHLGPLKARVYQWFQKHGSGTDEEMIDSTGLSPSTARPRRGELVEMGLLKDSGKRQPTRSGKLAVIWTVTEEAR